MIRINLLGDSGHSDGVAKMWIAGYALSVIVCFGACVMFYTSVSGEVVELTRERNDLQSQLDSLMTRTKTVRELEAKKATLRDKLSLIARLKKSKRGPVRVMDDLNVAIPTQVWLREVAEKKGELKINGRALTNQDIAMFMQSLERSEYFSNVELKESRQMYYSKRTGMVSPTADINAIRSADFSRDSRATKEEASKDGAVSGKKWGIRRDSEEDQSRKGKIDEANVKIKEFVVTATVHYEGSLFKKTTEQS